MPSIHPLPRPAALLAALAAALLCAHGARAQNADTAASRRPRLIPLLPPSYGPAEVEREETAGLRFRIQEVRSGSAVEQAPAAAGRPLTPAEASLLLARLRPLASKGEPADSFAFPAQSFPPPRAGRVIANAFPPRDAARAPARPAVRTPAALEVIRRAPEGEVNDPAELSITFSQPMVPLSSVSVVAAAAVPARLSPHVEGRWRWLDTRTLRFEPTGALPRASDVTVEIPAGTRSASGAALAGPVRWTFSTNAPRATGSWPQRASAPMRLDPVFVVAFDQRVDAEAVLRTIRVHAGGAGVPLRLATRDEVAADSDAARRTAGLRAGEWVAFRAVRPLPPDVTVRVSVGPGTPSAEGPRVTPAEQYWEFTTRGAFRVTRTADTRRAGEAFALSLSNPVDAAAFRPGMVRAEPAIEGMEAWAAGASLVVSGRTRANTRYVIRLAPELRDTFGQRLGDAPPVTVAVGLPYASIGAPRDVVVLDPLGPRSITVMTLAHSRVRLRVMRVRPEDWFTFYHSPWRPARRLQPPGTPVVDREVALDGTPGEPHPLEVDLSPALAGGAGQALVAVEALDGQTDGERRQAVYVWVQATRIGLAVFTDATGLTAWATSLVDGAPVTGARLELIGPGTANAGAATDARGVASMALPPSSGSHGRLLVARRGADVAVLAPEMVTYWGSGWARASMRPAALWHHFTDRTLYRPGETVHFKGWVRGLGVRDGSPELLPFAIGSGVAWTASDGEGNEIARGTSPVTALGGFDGAFTVPAGANLGDAEIEVKLPYPPAGLTGSSTTIHYHIDEFRRPEYTVTATADEGPHHVGGSAELSARATYFAGGALPGAPVTWEMTAWPGTFAPPGWSEWSFGDGEGGAARTEALSLATDARGRSTVRVDFPAADPPRPYVVNAQATVTDVNRQTWTAYTGVLVHPASVYLGLRTRRPWLARGDSIRLEMVAVDLDGRPVPGRSLEVRAQARTWRQQNGRWSEVTVDSATCTRVSAATPVRCAFPATHAGWYRLAATTRDARGRPTRSATRVWVTGRGALFSAPGARNDADSVDLVPDKESYQVGDTARILVRTRFTPSRGLVTVRRSGLARTQTLLLDGSTGTFSIPITEADVPNTWIGVDLVGANTATGEGGARGVDHASGKVRLNVPPATRTLSVRTLPRDSVLGPDAPASVGVVVRDAAGRPVANAEVALVVVDEAVLALAGYARPNPLAAFYPTRHGDLEEVNLRPLVQVVAPGYPPAAGTLVGRVSDAATGAYLAGATVAVDGTQLTATTDAVGRFRIAGVAPGRYALLVTMNEFTPARLAVTVGDTPPPPVHVALVPTLSATQIRMRGITSLNLNALVTTGAGVETVVAVGTPGVEIGPAGRGSPIRVRANFDPLAVFTPAVRTDAAGRARVPFTLPSSLTRYRVIAVAVHGGTRYGVGEAAITARQPLMVRPSPPRFLNWGDRMELPVVLQNQTGAPLEASVAARADGIELLDAGRRVVIPAHGRVEVRLRAAASRAGQATLQVAASAGGLSDAAELSLPVYTPATAEAFAAYGTFAGDSGVALPLQVPGDAIPSFGGLEVSASSTALQELTDALLYLVRYPFECSEQVASRVLGVAALRDVLTSFGAAEMPSPEALRESVRRDVRLLAGRQNEAGAVGFWEAGGEDYPYASIHAAHALQRAREKGYEVPDEAMGRALTYLRRVPANVPAWYPADVKRALHAYAIYVRARMADTAVAGDVRRFVSQTRGDSMTVEMAGWLLSAAAANPGLRAERDELLRIIGNHAAETASTATFATRYTEGEYLLMHSSRRTDGVVLEALVAADPNNPLVPKAVRGLLGHRVRGRWQNTQENAWVLLALDRYFRVFEGETPEFVARVWLGGRYAGGHGFAGRRTDRWQLSVPMRVLGEHNPPSITLGKEGAGRVYYRAGLRYAPRQLELAPLDAGFSLSRRYDAVDDAADVRQDAGGTWHVRAGARVRVTLTMTAPSRRLHVALVDPLPAGLEPVNPELQGARSAPPAEPGARTGDYEEWWRRYWYQHQNLRDDRAEAFTPLLRAGTYTWSYVARATTPGQFVAPPPRAEEMYSPETFGRGASDRVVVDPPGGR